MSLDSSMGFGVMDPIEPERLLAAYACGLFPMGMEDGGIGWFCPDPRGIMPLDGGFHISRSLGRRLARDPFEMRLDTAFVEVVEGCADREETWISENIFRSYVALYGLGHAHSVEAWCGGRLVGGLYGVTLGGAFFGESMFSRETDASKACLVYLVGLLRAWRYALFDVQWTTPHLERFGAREIRREEYLCMLEGAIEGGERWGG